MSGECEHAHIVGEFKEKAMTYEVPDMKWVAPVDQTVDEEMAKTFEPSRKVTRTKPKAKGNVTNTSSSLTDLDLSTTQDTIATDKILSDVVDMEENSLRSTRSRTARQGKKPSAAAKKVTPESPDVPVADAKAEEASESIHQMSEDTVTSNVGKTPKKSDARANTPKVVIKEEDIINKSKACILTSFEPASIKQQEFDSPAWRRERNTLVLPKRRRELADPDCSHIISVYDHNYPLWESLTSHMQACGNKWDALYATCRTYATIVQLNNRVQSVFGVRLDWDNRDWLAHSMWPRDGPYDREFAFEINTEALGDCLLAAISRIVFASQNHTRELRTRMTYEAVTNMDWYLDIDNLSLDLPALGTDKTIVEKYVLFSGTNETDAEQCYKDEVIRCFKSGAYCALWQIHHLATVICRPIITVFPEFDDSEDLSPLRYYHNRTIIPRRETDRQSDPVTIMWTMSHPTSKAFTDHFVAVVR